MTAEHTWLVCYAAIWVMKFRKGHTNGLLSITVDIKHPGVNHATAKSTVSYVNEYRSYAIFQEGKCPTTRAKKNHLAALKMMLVTEGIYSVTLF